MPWPCIAVIIRFVRRVAVSPTLQIRSTSEPEPALSVWINAFMPSTGSSRASRQRLPPRGPSSVGQTGAGTELRAYCRSLPLRRRCRLSRGFSALR